MTPDEFQSFMTELEGLDDAQMEALLKRAHSLDSQSHCGRLIEECLGTPAACPHCGSDAVIRFGYTSNGQRFR